MHPQRIFRVETAAQWRLFRSTAKNRVLRAFIDQKPRSVSDAAKWLGQPPQSVYPHLEALEAAGVLTRVEGEGTIRYAFPYDSVSLDFEDATQSSAEGWDEVIRGTLRTAERVFTDHAARTPAHDAKRHSLTSEEALLTEEEATQFALELQVLRAKFHDATVCGLSRPVHERLVRVNLLLGVTEIENGTSPARRAPARETDNA
ncbi:MAG: ArsR family transcriptional regulator [Phycisphaerales bacterium]|nr:ArsR family transcriptional regulator [Phycisphaerales bacterium]